MITWQAHRRGVCAAFATLIAVWGMAAGQAAAPLPADAKLGKQIGRIQRGPHTILLYERGDIVVSREGTNTPPKTVAKRQPADAQPRSNGLPLPESTHAVPGSKPIVSSPTPYSGTPALQPVTHAPEPKQAPEPESPATTEPKQTLPSDTTDDVAGLIADLAAPKESVRRQARQALIAQGGPRVIDPLMALLSSTDAPAHSHAAAAHILGELRATEAVVILSQQLLAEGFGARVEAAVALGAIGDPAAAPALIKAIKLGDHSVDLRIAIYRAIGEIDNKIAIRPLMIWLRQEQFANGQIEAAAALDRLTGQKFGENNAKRMAWLQANHPEWLENAPDTQVDRRYVSIMRMVAAGTLVGAGVIILMYMR